MNVFTYYEPINDKLFKDYEHILQVWQQSWSRNGWTPIVIGESQFRLHQEAALYDDLVSQLPTTNPKEYDRACFRRWLAMATLGGVMTDADVVNRSFSPGCLLYQSNLMIMGEHQVPCVVHGSRQQYLEACHQFTKYQVRPTDLFKGRPLVEDMTILRALHPADWFYQANQCGEYNSPRWEFKSLVHCSSESLGTRKLEVMKSLL